MLVSSFIYYGCQTASVSGTEHLRKGDQFNNANDYGQAIYHYEEYLKMAPSLGLYRNIQREAEVCRKLAHAYSTQGKYQASLKYLKQALATDTTLHDNRLNIIKDYESIGRIHAYRGDIESAREFIAVALQQIEGLDKSIKEENRRSFADAYLSMAQINFAGGEYFKAEKEAGEALTVYERIKDEFGMMEATLLLGAIHIIRDELDEGILLIKRSIDLAVKNDFSVSRQFQMLGDALVSAGELEEGLTMKLRAVDQAEKSNILPQMVWSYIKAGDTYELIGNEQEAMDYYRKANELRNRLAEDTSAYNPSLELRLGDVQRAYERYLAGDSRLGLGLAGLKLAGIYLSQGKLVEAHALANRSVVLFEEMGSAEGQANGFLLLGRIFQRMNRHDSSAYYISRAEQKTSRPETRWKVQFAMGEFYSLSDEPEKAIEHFGEAVDIIEGLRGSFTLGQLKTAFLSNRIDVYDRMIREMIHLSGSRKEQKEELIARAFEFSEKARARNFLDMLGNRHIQPRQKSDSALLDREQLMRIQLGQYAGEDTPEETEKHNTPVDLLQKDYRQLVDELVNHNPDYSSVMSVEPPAVSDIQGQIDDQTVLISYWISEDQLFIWTLSTESLSFHSVEISRADIEKLVTQVRTLIRFKVREELDPVMKELYQRLIQPVKDIIIDYDKICIIPHRSLHFLPFHALIQGNNRYMIEDHVMYYVPSASIFYYSRLKNRPQASNVLAMALGEKQIQGFAPLPGTTDEVNHISQLYDGEKILIGDASTETFFKEYGKDYSIIHLATHGVLNRNQPFQSYVLMNEDFDNDGKLKIDEVFSLNLHSKLVVISACETGLGKLDKGDELIGLSRSLMYSGTPSVIASLWTVNDLSTAVFMVKLHQYLQNGWDLSESITYAQRDMINLDYTTNNVRSERSERTVVWDDQVIDQISTIDQSDKRNVYYWAPFILIGDGLTGNITH